MAWMTSVWMTLTVGNAAADAESVSSFGPRVERAAAEWRNKGESAIPAMVRALCSNDVGLRTRAGEMLIDVGGATAVAPLINARASSRSCLDFDVEETIAGILCSAPASAQVATKRLATAVAPLVAALGHPAERRAQIALDAITDMTRRGLCDNRAVVLETTASSALKFLDMRQGVDKAETMDRLQIYGPYAAPSLDKAIVWLDDPTLVSEAAALIGAMGPLAGRAVPRLRQLLAGPHASSAAQALGQLGEAARDALPEMIHMFEQAAGADCNTPVAVRTLLQPIVQVAATRDDVPVVPVLVHALHTCKADEKVIVAALVSLGAKGASAGPDLVALIRDDTRTIFERLQLAEQVASIHPPLSAFDRDLFAALRKKDDLQRLAIVGVGQGWHLGSANQATGSSFLDAARRELRVCGQEAGRTSPGIDAALPTAETAQLETLYRCIQNRLCGPHEDSYVATLRVCCGRAFGQPAPAWCSAN